MTKITFLRHAESQYNVEQKFAGRIDCHITSKGAREAQALASKLPKFNIYYCSPLIRTQETLAAIFPNITPIIDERITEVSLGIWEDMAKDSVDAQLRKQFLEGSYTPPKAESIDQVNKRAISFLEDLFTTYTNDKRILVVTHNGFLRSVRKLYQINPKTTHVGNLSYFSVGKNGTVFL